MPIVGRESVADIVLPAASVSARHAYIEPLGENLYLVRDLESANGVFVNGLRVREATVTPADQLQFGSLGFEWTVYLPVLETELQKGKGWTLGRQPGNDLIIPDPRLSARHARVRLVDASRLELTDLGSVNGVFVNGRQVTRAMVGPADEICFGSMRIGLWRLLDQHGLLPDRGPAKAAPPAVMLTHAVDSSVSAAASRPRRAWFQRQISGHGKSLTAAAAALVIVLAVAAWAMIAQRRLDLLSTAASGHLDVLAAPRSAVVDESGAPARAIAFTDLERYVRNFDTNVEKARLSVASLEDGTGVNPWFPVRRADESNRLASMIDAEESLANDARLVVQTVSAANAATVAAINRSSGARRMATNLLDPTTDVDEYLEGSGRLLDGATVFESSATRIRSMRNERKLADRAEMIRNGVFNGFDMALSRESDEVGSRLASLRVAAERLRTHKSELRQSITTSTGTIALVHRVSTTMLPAVAFAHEKTRPLRDLMRRASQPLPAANLASFALRAIGQGESTGSMTPLALATSASPQTRAAVEGLRAICEGIEVAHRETTGAVAALEPVVSATTAFTETGTRASMLQLAAAAPNAAAYFESRRNAFDPLIQKADELRSTLGYLTESSHGGPLVRSFLQGASSLGNEVIDAAQSPLVSARALMTEVAANLREVASKENAYRARLVELRERPGPAGPMPQIAEQATEKDNL